MFTDGNGSHQKIIVRLEVEQRIAYTFQKTHHIYLFKQLYYIRLEISHHICLTCIRVCFMLGKFCTILFGLPPA